VLLTGKFDHTIDAKGRVAIPAELRSRLESAGYGTRLYAIMGANDALWLWPEAVFEQMAGDLEPTLTPASDLMDFDEITFPEARLLDIDKTGRIRIPEELLEESGIRDKVVVLGMRNHLELRTPEDWEARRRAKAARRAEILERARDEIKRGGPAE
jgi:MraZ protein